MVGYMDKYNLRECKGLVRLMIPVIILPWSHLPQEGFLFDLIGTLNGIEALLMHVGPLLSAILFITAGIFYALGQLFPSYKRATLHTMAIDMIVGAIMVAVLSVAANGFAVASTTLLTNLTSNSL